MTGEGTDEVVDVSGATGYFEVNVSPDGSFANGDFADVTIGFHLRTSPPPRPLTEAELRSSIGRNLSMVAAAIEAMLVTNGAVHAGQVEDPMVKHGTVVGESRTTPVRVVLHDAPQSGAKAVMNPWQRIAIESPAYLAEETMRPRFRPRHP